MKAAMHLPMEGRVGGKLLPDMQSLMNPVADPR